MSNLSSVWTRLIGVGVTAVLAVITLVLFSSGKIALYINPDGSWFAAAMAIVALIACVASFAIPLGDEAEHGHDHGTDVHDHDHAKSGAFRPAALVGVIGGVIALTVTGAALVLPHAALSAQTAMDRDVGVTPLFGGNDVVALATTGDTAKFGVGDWATVFATASDARIYEGTEVTLTGFITPTGDSGAVRLTRLVVTHCVIDAQPASVPLGDVPQAPKTGQWVSVKGKVIADAKGALSVSPTSVEAISQPTDPYEY